MSEITPKNYNGLMEAYASIYNKPEQTTQEQEFEINEEAFCSILIDYLVVEGYVKTEEQALKLIPHIGEGWMNFIVSHIYISECFYSSINSLIEEGYDLSSYTEKDLFETYVEECFSQNLNEAVPLAIPLISSGIGLLGGLANLAKGMQKIKPAPTGPSTWDYGQSGTSTYKPKPAPAVAKPAPKPNVYKAEVTSSENRPAKDTPTGTTTRGVRITGSGGDPSSKPPKKEPPEWQKKFFDALLKRGEKKPPSPIMQQAKVRAAEVAGKAVRKLGLGSLGLAAGGLVDQGLLGGIGGKITRDVTRFSRSLGPGYEGLKREIKGEPEPAPAAPAANPSQRPLRRDKNGNIIGLGGG